MASRISSIRTILAGFLAPETATTLPLWRVREGEPTGAAGLSKRHKDWIKATGWKAGSGQILLLPGDSGVAGGVYAAAPDDPSGAGLMSPGALPSILPEGDYHLADDGGEGEMAALAWLLGAYAFQRYMTAEKRQPRRLRLPPGVDRERVLDIAQAVWLARDLINTPANEMGPEDIEAAVTDTARHFGAETRSIVGEDLLAQGFRLHHAVGRASERAPRLIELAWSGAEQQGGGAPSLTLVGKGICFDTGGLNIKTGSGMQLMKKDMAGAATALALSAMIMARKLPVRLRLLIPAADNSIAGNAFRPGDIIRSRAGLTVEITNTDAEGRLVLADAIDYACEGKPDTLVTFATLTGAARVALGPDLPPFYSTDDEMAGRLAAASMRVGDPVWRMPFWQGYDSYLKSDAADIINSPTNGFAGSVVAALFLKRFARKAGRFVHFDIYGWSPRAMPGKPLGGEPQAARALFSVVEADTGGKR
jgi:leucyl aminopeptidase